MFLTMIFKKKFTQRKFEPCRVARFKVWSVNCWDNRRGDTDDEEIVINVTNPSPYSLLNPLSIQIYININLISIFL